MIKTEIIKIVPKCSFLSAPDLINERNEDIETQSVGLKRTVKDNNSEAENLELESIYGKLEKQLSRPRIERLGGRALAVWDDKEHAACVVRKDGKFGNFGYSRNGEHYLKYYESMFLLEVNRLQLEYNSSIVSIEQAYVLLMGENASEKYTEYIVYSNLTRAGYIVVGHNNIHFTPQAINSYEDCVWAILEAELHNECVKENAKKSEYYGNAWKQFNLIKQQIVNQDLCKDQESYLTTELESELNFESKIKPNLKRKSENQSNKWHAAKRRCINSRNTFQQSSLIDFLTDEDEFKQFRNMYEKFDIVPLKQIDIENLEMKDVCPMSIHFDCYLRNDNFRKSNPRQPDFRIIVLKPKEKFPTYSQIFVTHRQQLCRVPILIVSVNDSKQLQAFLYYFS